LPWDLILGSDLVKHYKPDREMYLSAPLYLDLKPEEVRMCAAHIPDLQAARSYGRNLEQAPEPQAAADRARAISVWAALVVLLSLPVQWLMVS
jgi:FMN phosphatase YigB (HAD superfamily)